MDTHKHVDMRPAALAVAMVMLAASPTMALAAAATGGYAAAEPTADSALAADQQLATAMRNNDAAGIANMLDDDWVVIATNGNMGEGKDVFPSGIRSGVLIRKTFELVAPRVRLYGNVAVVTSKVKLSGVFHDKAFDIMERQTDVLVWKDSAWKCVLTHESKFEAPPKT